MFGGFSLFSTSTAQALVAVRGPAVTYGLLKFTPLIESHAHSLDISGFTIRRGSEKFTLQDIPVSQILPEAARSDIVIRTYERDEDERSTYLEIDFEIREYDERVRIHFRAVENRSEEHTSELQSLMRISYAVFCLKKKKKEYNT